ncbi:MAG: pectinesterase family protein [Verrucomicrobiota bacterium JB022]|nr:pectinesterase family protein [Verrucomicrobiota bacterium JB022]
MTQSVLLRCFATGALTSAGLCATLAAQDTRPAVSVTLSTAQIAQGETPTAAETITIAPPGGGWAYSAVAPLEGQTFNVVKRPNPAIGSNSLSTKGTYPVNSATNLALADPNGQPSGVSLSVRLNIQDLDGNTTRTEPNSGSGGSSNLGPNGLMNEVWRIYRGGNSAEYELDGLPANAHYYVYFYGSTGGDGQGCRYTFPAVNSPSDNVLTVETTGGNGGNVFVENASQIEPVESGITWIRVHAKTDATGQLLFTTSKNANNGQYFGGFQLMPYPKATIDVAPPPSPQATHGSEVSIPVIASGDGTLTYFWRKNGQAIPDNPTAITATLVLTDVQPSDAANYDVVITNPGGDVTSSVAVLTVTDEAIAPSIVTAPMAVNATTGGDATFVVVPNGTSPLNFTWQKSLDNENFEDVPNSNSAVLTIHDLTTENAGYYRVKVQNSVGSATSEAAPLTVAPVIVEAPTQAIVERGTAHTVSVEADAGEGAPYPTTYTWTRDGETLNNDTNVQGADTATLQLQGMSPALSGYYTVTASNPAGSVTSAAVYVGVPTTQAVSYAPHSQMTGISIDQQLRLTFPSQPKIGQTGVITIRDAADDSVAASIDVSTFETIVFWSATITNVAERSVQGSDYWYEPVAIHGNEVWITLSPEQRLDYGKTYYVEIEPGTILDSENAAFAGISGPDAWRFTTKANGLETPTPDSGPTTITVAHDGRGDFATLQAAFDWIPQGNTLPRTIRIAPGVYRDNATLAQNRHHVTIIGTGDSRDEVEIYYPYAAFSNGGNRASGTLRIESDDVTVQNLTVDNGVYLEQPTASAPAFAGPINTVATTGRRLVFENVLMKGGQDTLYTIRGIAYFQHCEIWGSVDFIYGEALGVFHHCDIVQIRPVGGPVGAPNTPYDQPYGEVFLQSNFPRALVANGYPYDVNEGSTTFMRPWRQDGATAVINCVVDTHFSTKGWGEWSAAEGSKEVTCRAREYGTTLFGGGIVTPEERHEAGAYWLNTLDPDYTPGMQPSHPSLAPATGTGNRVVVEVDPADYTLEAIFGHSYYGLNGWMPAYPPRITTHPVSQSVALDAPVTLSVEAVGQGLSYQWYQDGVIIPEATGATHTIAAASLGNRGDYTVEITNDEGFAESHIARLEVQSSLADWAAQYGLDASVPGFATSDADGDGLANALEFLLATHPNQADRPQIVAGFNAAQGTHTVTYLRSFAAATLYSEQLQVSTDLATWTPASPGENDVTQTIEPLPNGIERVTLHLTSAQAPLFARLVLQP